MTTNRRIFETIENIRLRLPTAIKNNGTPDPRAAEKYQRELEELKAEQEGGDIDYVSVVMETADCAYYRASMTGGVSDSRTEKWRDLVWLANGVSLTVFDLVNKVLVPKYETRIRNNALGIGKNHQEERQAVVRALLNIEGETK